MQSESVTYEAGGLTLRSQLFLPEAVGKSAGVLVFPEAFGLNDHAKERARRLAQLGYAAMACDIHGQGELIDDLGAALQRLEPLYADAARMRGVGLAAYHALSARNEVAAGRIAAIGFCFGGTMSLELARAGTDLRAAVGFHSGLKTKAPATAGDIKARVLACIGADDPFIPPEERTNFEAEMRESGCRLANASLWQHGSQLHQPGGCQTAETRGDPLRRQGGCAFLGVDAGTL